MQPLLSASHRPSDSLYDIAIELLLSGNISRFQIPTYTLKGLLGASVEVTQTRTLTDFKVTQDAGFDATLIVSTHELHLMLVTDGRRIYPPRIPTQSGILTIDLTELFALRAGKFIDLRSYFKDQFEHGIAGKYWVHHPRKSRCVQLLEEAEQRARPLFLTNQESYQSLLSVLDSPV